MTTKIQKTDAEWRAELSPEQYEILRRKGTERAFTGEYVDTKDPGVYRCAARPVLPSTKLYQFGSWAHWLVAVVSVQFPHASVPEADPDGLTVQWRNHTI